MDPSEDAVVQAKRARKLSDKATVLSSSAAKRPKLSGTVTDKNSVLVRNAVNGVTFRGSVYTSVPPIQPCFEHKLLPSVALSLYDKAVQLKLSDDQLVCYGCEGGYRMVRATHGVERGSYYWEAEILPSEGSDHAHYRIGWSTRQGELQAPVGFDQHSFGYRSINGARVHKSIRIDDYGDSYTTGDVIGCFIHLDIDPSLNRIVFFKNGISQGEAFSGADIPSSIYFPAISIYNDGIVQANFGPCFICRCDTNFNGVNAVSELQPMSSEDRMNHEKHIHGIRAVREQAKELQQDAME